MTRLMHDATMASSLAASKRELPRDVLMSKCATREMNINNSVEKMRFRRAARNIEKELRSQEHYLSRTQQHFMRRNVELLQQRQRAGSCKAEMFKSTSQAVTHVKVPTIEASSYDLDVSLCDQKSIKTDVASCSTPLGSTTSKLTHSCPGAGREGEQHRDIEFVDPLKMMLTPSRRDRSIGGITASTISSCQKASHRQGLISKDREAELLSALIITPLKTYIPVVERETKTGAQLKLQEFLDRATMESKPTTPLSYKEEMQRRFSRVYGPEKRVPTKLVSVTPRSSFSETEVRKESPLVLPPIILPPIHECPPRRPRPMSWHYVDRNKLEKGITDEEWEKLKNCRYLRIRPTTSCAVNSPRECNESFTTLASE